MDFDIARLMLKTRGLDPDDPAVVAAFIHLYKNAVKWGWPHPLNSAIDTLCRQREGSSRVDRKW